MYEIYIYIHVYIYIYIYIYIYVYIDIEIYMSGTWCAAARAAAVQGTPEASGSASLSFRASICSRYHPQCVAVCCSAL